MNVWLMLLLSAVIVVAFVVVMKMFFAAIDGYSDGMTDAMFRDQHIGSFLTFQRQSDDPGIQRPIRRSIYIVFYKRGWNKQLRIEATKKPDKPRIMP